MLFVEYAKSSPELAPYLYGYVQRISEPNRPEIIEPVIARSGAMLEFHLGEPFDVSSYGLDLPNPTVPITVIGPMTARHVLLIIRGRVEALTVLFRPLGFYRIFEVPLAPLTGTGTEGGDVLGAPVRALHEQLGNLRSFADRVKTLDSFLRSRLRQNRSWHPAHGALQVLSSAGTAMTVRAAANLAGISTRQLERLS